MKVFIRILTLASLVSVQVLATSCGGGGGDERPFSEVEVEPELQAAYVELASATPTAAGSSVSSSPYKESGATAVTVEITDLALEASVTVANFQIAVTGDFDFTLSILNAESSRIRPVRSSTDYRATFERVEEGKRERTYFRFIRDGDTDWVALGSWSFVENYRHDSLRPTWNLGVFADTSNAPSSSSNVMAQTGPYEYLGLSDGTVFGKYSNGDNYIDNYEADVILSADFSDSSSLGSIRGSLSNFKFDDGTSDDPILLLKEADIGDTNGGFFTGDIAGVGLDGTEYGSGKWGGQFYGKGAEGVLGTYSGTVTSTVYTALLDEDLSQVWMAGAFVAERDAEPSEEEVGVEEVEVGVEVEVGAELQAAYEELASATPTAAGSSVSSSSNKDRSGATADTVEITDLGLSSSGNVASYQIAVTGDVDFTLNILNADYSRIRPVKSSPDYRATFERVEEGNRERTYFRFFRDLAGETDWVALGSWSYVEDYKHDSLPPTWNIGNFADTSNVFSGNVEALTGVYDYLGQAEGSEILKFSTGDYGSSNYEADVSLTANFGDSNALGTIGGSLSNFKLDDGTSFDSILILLKDANIGSGNGGFFTGDIAGVGLDGPEFGSGKWGGQFYGNGAEGVLGTYSGTYPVFFGDDEVPSQVWMSGAFVAERQQ